MPEPAKGQHSEEDAFDLSVFKALSNTATAVCTCDFAGPERLVCYFDSRECRRNSAVELWELLFQIEKGLAIAKSSERA